MKTEQSGEGGDAFQLKKVLLSLVPVREQMRDEMLVKNR
jgi:hypothetical protein